MKLQVTFEAIQKNAFVKTVIVEVPNEMAESDLDGDILEAIRDFRGDEGWERSFNDRDDFQFVSEPKVARIESNEEPDLRLTLKDGEVCVEAVGGSIQSSPVSRGGTRQIDQRNQNLRKDDADKKHRVLIHWVSSGKGNADWIHTHGLSDRGLPELEIRNVPGFLGEKAASLLRHVSDYMLDSGNEVRLGETMATSDRTRFRFTKDRPIPGEEDHYEVERWRLVEVGIPCDECGAQST